MFGTIMKALSRAVCLPSFVKHRAQGEESYRWNPPMKDVKPAMTRNLENAPGIEKPPGCSLLGSPTDGWQISSFDKK